MLKRDVTTENAQSLLNDLQLIYEISELLSEMSNIHLALHQVLQKIAAHHQILSGSIMIYNIGTKEIETEEYFGMTHEAASKGRYRVGEGITGRVFDTGVPIAIPRISECTEFLDRTGIHEKMGKKETSFICVPIKTGPTVMGALSVSFRYSKDTVLSSILRILSIVTQTISLAVHIRQENVEELAALRRENSLLQAELSSGYHPQNIIGNTQNMRTLYSQIEQVSKTTATVLLLGESGVGKEEFAHAIHYHSLRNGKPFIKVNCAALPENLIESELFGHERGAFTNAIERQKGRFERADCGTIFLDEIGEMPLPVQSRFLRVLQEHEFERIGGTETIHVNLRVIAATNRNLLEMVKAGLFREDLYYRLNVFPLVIPPLRERKADIVLLALHFVELYAKEQTKHITQISSSAQAMLVSYNWPGNVRELSNCMERAVILSTDGIIHTYHLPPALQQSQESVTDISESHGTLEEIVSAFEREVIKEELDKNQGNMAKTARSLGVTERILALRVSKYNLKESKVSQTRR
jgi:Nif-specific regulatory protein